MLNLLKTRRSIRKYKDMPVEEEKIDTIIKAALTSPSGHAKRGWKLILIDHKDLLVKLANSRGQHSKFLKDAPLGFVLAIDPNDAIEWQVDLAIMATIIQITAQSLGLASCWISAENVVADDGSNMEDNIRSILNISNNNRILCMISVGYPDEIKKEHNEAKFKYSSVYLNGLIQNYRKKD